MNTHMDVEADQLTGIQAHPFRKQMQDDPRRILKRHMLQVRQLQQQLRLRSVGHCVQLQVAQSRFVLHQAVNDGRKDDVGS